MYHYGERPLIDLARRDARLSRRVRRNLEILDRHTRDPEFRRLVRRVLGRVARQDAAQKDLAQADTAETDTAHAPESAPVRGSATRRRRP